MRTYRLGEGINGEGLPFLLARHAYLADGTPLTECDTEGRIVPARAMIDTSKATCSGGLLGIAERHRGVEALARALNDGDLVRAPLLLLFLQIDPAPDPSEDIAKYNPWHKPHGPGGGQFTTGPGAGFQNIAQDMHVRFSSTYQSGVNDPTIDLAHQLVMALVAKAILTVSQMNFRPGMPGYGQKLHDQLAMEITALGDPNLRANPVYFNEQSLEDQRIPAGSSVPDVVYGPFGQKPLAAWELKTGRAANISDPATIEQRERTLKNMPGEPLYEYIFVRGE
jgi:hypothetical protein